MRPHVVGVGWVVNSVKASNRESEEKHRAEFADVLFTKVSLTGGCS